MAALNIKLTDEELEALRRYAARGRTPISWLVRDYLQYVLRGGEPVAPRQDEELSSADLAAVARHGGAFD